MNESRSMLNRVAEVAFPVLVVGAAIAFAAWLFLGWRTASPGDIAALSDCAREKVRTESPLHFSIVVKARPFTVRDLSDMERQCRDEQQLQTQRDAARPKGA